MKTFLKQKMIYKCFCLFVLFMGYVYAQPISPNGYSGLGLIPSSHSINSGQASISFDPNVPGALVLKGFNTKIGFGLSENFELIGRLATNDQRCNMFKVGACPANTIRDFSASLKWSLPIDWLKKK